MGLSSNLAVGQLATRMQSAAEFKLGALSERRLALLGKAANLASTYSEIAATDDTEDDIQWEEDTKAIQLLDKEIETQMTQLETKLAIYSEMKENFLKEAGEEAKESFTIDA